MTENERSLLSLGALARRIRVPASWLRAEAEAGRIPHIRAGRALLFDAETVERLILERLRSEAKGVRLG